MRQLNPLRLVKKSQQPYTRSGTFREINPQVRTNDDQFNGGMIIGGKSFCITVNHDKKDAIKNCDSLKQLDRCSQRFSEEDKKHWVWSLWLQKFTELNGSNPSSKWQFDKI